MENTGSEMGATPGPGDLRWGDTFLNRFDGKVRGVGCLIHPSSGEEFLVDRRAVVQSFRRAFGQVTQFVLLAGLFKKRQLCLAAISLEDGGLEATAQGVRPAEDLYRQVSSPTGLDFSDDTFYGVGIFSPVGWPVTWKRHVEIRSNVYFYVVEKREKTRWDVFGKESPLRDLFNPETSDEKKVRGEKDLANHPGLVLPGDQVPLDSFLGESGLDRGTVEEVIRSSRGLQLINHKGRWLIQRTVE